MANFQVKNLDMLVVGLLTSLVLTFVSFWNVKDIFTSELLISVGFTLLVVWILGTYLLKIKYIYNLLLIYFSFNLMNIIYIYLFSFSVFLVPNFVISLVSFIQLAYLPSYRSIRSVSKDKYTRTTLRTPESKDGVSKKKLINYQIRDTPKSSKNTKIIVEDFKTGKKSDLESEMKRSNQKSTKSKKNTLNSLNAVKKTKAKKNTTKKSTKTKTSAKKTKKSTQKSKKTTSKKSTKSSRKKK